MQMHPSLRYFGYNATYKITLVSETYVLEMFFEVSKN